jgi:hypothetical protein
MPTVPGTLAAKIRGKFPGAYDDLDDATLESKWDAKYPGAYDDIPRSTLPKRPVSAEDFTDPNAGIQTPTLGGFLRKTGGALVDTLAGTAKTIASGPLAVQSIADASVEQGKKAYEDARRGRYSEAVGHALGAVPLVGPAVAKVGEAFGTGDIEQGLADATALAAPGLAAKLAPRVAPPLASIGEQLASKGKALATKAGPVVGELAKTVPMELAAHYLGAPIGAGAVTRIVLKSAMEAAKKAPAAAPEVGTLVRDASGAPVKVPTLSQMLADSLAETGRPEPPARVTTAPPAALPPGYTPRSTVPKPRRLTPVEAAKVAEERTPEPVRKRAYFLKPETTAAPVEAVEPTGRVEVADLPESWRARTGAEPIDPQGVAGEQAAAQFAQELRSRGMSIGEAVMRVSQNKALPTGVRLQIIDALKKSARMAAVNR